MIKVQKVILNYRMRLFESLFFYLIILLQTFGIEIRIIKFSSPVLLNIFNTQISENNKQYLDIVGMSLSSKCVD